MFGMRRRAFITLLGGAAAAWPLAARAQKPARVRRIVFLHALAEDDPEVQARLAAFRQGLETFGWAENRNIQIEHRFSYGDIAQMQAHTADLVSSAPDVIVASSTPVIAALKDATRTIPIVFAMLNDPVGQGFVASLSRLRQFVGEGALITYGPDSIDIVRRSTSYVDRILKGEKPADLPVQSPTKYELAINLKTAKALGLIVPDSLLARADEVIE
jgi:ABC-type uncharacterized transport system substrate-binding protein